MLLSVAAGALVLAVGYVVPRLGGGSGSGPDTRAEDPSGVSLVCDAAVLRACASAATSMGLTAIEWVPGSAPPDRSVLIVPAGDLPEGLEPGPVVMRSPIVIGVWHDRLSILDLACGGVDFACLGEVYGRSWEDIGGSASWGDVALGLADPTQSEPGLAAWAAVTGSAPPFDISRSLFLVSRSDASLAADAVLRRSSADILVTTEVALAGQFENAIGRGGRLTIVYPQASPWISYVAVAQGFGSGGVVEDLLSTETAPLLAAAGVRPVATVPASAYPEGFGDPGAEAAIGRDRATLIESWNRIR